jgi:hypothetical protein
VVGVAVRMWEPPEVISLVVRGRSRMATRTWEVAMVPSYCIDSVLPGWGCC